MSDAALKKKAAQIKLLVLDVDGTSVSYTHLDVYKRQLLCGSKAPQSRA